MSDSFSFNDQVGASDNAIGLSANTGTAVAKDNGIALAQGATLKTGVDVGAVSGGSTINIGDPNASKTFADTIKSLTESNNKELNDIVQNQTRANIPDASTDLPDTTDTTAKTSSGFSWLWLAAPLAGLAVLYFLFRRK